MKHGLLALLVCAVGVIAVQAQDNTQQGLVPFQAYHSGNIDSVNLANGTLVLNIPLLSYPQRGHLPALNIIVLANSATWYSTSSGWNTGTDWAARPNAPTRPTPYISPLLVLNQQKFITGAPNSDNISLFTALDSSGANHVLGTSSFQSNTSGTPVFPGTEGMSADTSDGTGIHLDGNAHPANLYDSNGNRWFSAIRGFGGVADVNGNQITAQGPTDFNQPFGVGVIDSVGRGIPAVPVSNVYSAPACTTVNFPGQNGVTVPGTFCYASYPVSTAFPTGTQYSGSWTLLQSVTLPDGTWTFDYNNYGDVTSITLPTGGTISYTYTSQISCSSPLVLHSPSSSEFVYNRVVATRTVDAHDGTPAKMWAYTINGNVTTMTDPDLNDTVHTFTIIHNAVCSPYETKVQYYQGSSSGGQLLRTVETQYSDRGNSPFYSTSQSALNVLPVLVKTTLPTGLVSQETYQYDSSCAG